MNPTTNGTIRRTRTRVPEYRRTLYRPKRPSAIRRLVGYGVLR